MFVSPLDSSPQVYSKSYPVKPKCTEINKDFQKDNFKHEIDIEALRKEQNLQEFINRTTKKGIYNDVQALVILHLKLIYFGVFVTTHLFVLFNRSSRP